MKKILATALAFTLTFGTFALPAVENGINLADKFAVSASAETYGDFRYNVLDDGTVEITGYSGDNENVTIPSIINAKKVTSIGNYAFHHCASLISLTIPNGVTSIENDAFYECSNLAYITIPNSIISIGNEAFYRCSSLVNITLSDNLLNIGDSAFRDCYNLKKITIPNSVTSIGNKVFYRCSNLKSIVMSKNIKNIGDSAFYECSNLAYITIPNSIVSIENKAFYGCSSLTNITIPNGVTSIGDCVFRDCSNLKEIIIPISVTNIEDSAFSGCSSLTDITIPNNVTNIGDFAFSGCSKLVSLTIPNSVTSIGDYAFNSCSNLSKLTMPDSIISIGDYVFNSCSSLTHITIPDNVISIGERAFNHCYRLTDVIIPRKIIIIKDYAFNCCDNLQNVFYKGTVSEWEDISIGNRNESLTKASIHYNSTGDSDTQKEISSCTISLPTATQYFRGTRIRPVVTIKDGTKVLKSGTDYTVSYTNNLSVGKATVTITGKGDYTGTVTKNFDIVQRSIGNCDVELGAANYYFNGTRIKPTVKVYCNGTEMYNGNYTVAYSNNLSAGTATITLTGKKNLKGTVTKTFKINPRNIANCTVELTKNSSNKYQPTVAVKLGSNSVYSGNYTVKYTTSADKKTVKVTLTGKGNLAGTITKTYTV